MLRCDHELKFGYSVLGMVLCIVILEAGVGDRFESSLGYVVESVEKQGKTTWRLGLLSMLVCQACIPGVHS